MDLDLSDYIQPQQEEEREQVINALHEEVLKNLCTANVDILPGHKGASSIEVHKAKMRAAIAFAKGVLGSLPPGSDEESQLPDDDHDDDDDDDDDDDEIPLNRRELVAKGEARLVWWDEEIDGADAVHAKILQDEQCRVRTSGTRSTASSRAFM